MSFFFTCFWQSHFYITTARTLSGTWSDMTPGCVYRQKATSVSLRNSSSSAQSTLQLNCSSYCRTIRCRSVMIGWLCDKLQRHKVSARVLAPFPQGELRGLKWKFNCTFWAFNSSRCLNSFVLLSGRLNGGFTFQISIFGLKPTVSRGNTCFLTQITHHLHLILLWPTFSTLFSVNVAP